MSRDSRPLTETGKDMSIMADNRYFDRNDQYSELRLPVDADETVEMEPLNRGRDLNGEGENRLGWENSLNANDIAAFEREVSREEESIGSDFEEIGMDNAAEIREGLLMSFNSDMYNDTLTFERTAAYKNNFAKTLTMEKDALADQNGPMAQAIDAQITALGNNWGVNDMDLIREFALSVATQSNEELKKQGRQLLNNIMNTHANTVDIRNAFLSGIEAYCSALESSVKDLKNPGGNMESSLLSNRVRDAKKRDLHYTEFPEDETVHNIASKNGAFDTIEEGVSIRNKKLVSKIGGPVRDYIKLETNYMLLAMEHNQKSFAEKQKIRGKGDYVMQKSDDVDSQPFKQSYVQHMAGIVTSNRTAAKSVFGDDVFDGSDALHEQESSADRTVPMHNAKGNKALLNGENVLEIDVAGSGLHLTERDYHGFTGNTYGGKRLDIWEQPITLQYGERIKLRGFEDSNSIRKKETNITVDGKTVNKTRYTIPGPMPKPTKNGKFRGLFDAGKYKIENSRAITQRIAEDYLTPIFEKWMEEKKKNPDFEPRDVRINISGYSRGAVSADGSINAIRDWISTHRRYNDFANKVKFTAILYDPVPGPDGSAKGYGKVDLRKDGKPDPNLDVTVFHSLSVNHPAFFTSQSVRGASRIILGTTMHSSTQDMVDNSQRGIVGDGKTHRRGFFETSTGECYRGSGLSDLPKGIYFADEAQNLVRLTSYAQLSKLLESLQLDKASASKSWKRFIPFTREFAKHMQDSRREVICDAVKTFMLDNPLDISFESEHERDYENKRLDGIVGDLLADQPAKGSMDRKALEAYTRLQETLKAYNAAGENTEERKEQRELVLKCAADFMRADTGKPETAKHMERISDLYSLLQRGKVYDEKGLTPSKGRQNLTEAAWKAQTKKAEERCAKLEKFGVSLEEMKKSAKDLLGQLNETRKDGKNSSLYVKMRESVRKVSELAADKDSLDAIKQAVSDLSKAADNYAKTRSSGAFHTRSAEGQKRIDIARSATEAANQFIERMNAALKGITQTDKTISGHLEYQNVRINELKDIGKRIKLEKRQEKTENKDEPRRDRPKDVTYRSYTEQLNLEKPTDLDVARFMAATSMFYNAPEITATTLLNTDKIDRLANTILREPVFRDMMKNPLTLENVKNGRGTELLEDLNTRKTEAPQTTHQAVNDIAPRNATVGRPRRPVQP